MKAALALLGAVVVSAAIAPAWADEESPFTPEQQLLMRSLAELRNKRETVAHIFEYCVKQDDRFALDNASILEGWSTRNQPYLRLTPGLQQQVAVLARDTFQMSEQDLEQTLHESSLDVATTFSRRLETESPEARVFVCRTYAGKVRDGEFDVAHNKPEVKQALDGYLHAAAGEQR